jgi:hypothetical protein
MKCPHCNDGFHPQRGRTDFQIDGDFWRVSYFTCPSCHRAVVELSEGPNGNGQEPRTGGSVPGFIAYPNATSRPIPAEVPDHIAKDFREASVCLQFSPNASAALSRRCLQRVLREAGNAKKARLVDEIEEVAKRPDVPAQLRQALDGLRHLGNFAAHPEDDKATGDVLDVEPEEAEWTLDILESLFDLFYVGPARLQARFAGLNDKLTAAGRQPMQGP